MRTAHEPHSISPMLALNQYLKKIPIEHHALVRALDAAILRAAPNLHSSLKWGNLTYHAEHNVCAIVAHKHYVNLQLWRGAELDDPRGLLEGTGKTMRHIKFLPDADVDWKYISNLIKQTSL